MPRPCSFPHPCQQALGARGSSATPVCPRGAVQRKVKDRVGCRAVKQVKYLCSSLLTCCGVLWPALATAKEEVAFSWVRAPWAHELWCDLYHSSPLQAERKRSFLAEICRGREWSQPRFNLDRSRWWEDCVLSWSFPLNSYGVEGRVINRHSILSTLVQFCLQLPI